MTYLTEKPSLDELAHFGVKGMKWGVRKASTDVGGSSKIANGLEKIKAKSQSRTNSILEARARVDVRKANYDKAETALKEMFLELSKHPDTKMARKRTTGEHVASLILGSAGPIAYRTLQKHINARQSTTRA